MLSSRGVCLLLNARVERHFSLDIFLELIIFIVPFGTFLASASVVYESECHCHFLINKFSVCVLFSRFSRDSLRRNFIFGTGIYCAK